MRAAHLDYSLMSVVLFLRCLFGTFLRLTCGLKLPRYGILGAEVTLSPIYMFAMGFIRKGSGLVMRFPTFTGSCRFGKSAEDVATARTARLNILFEPLSSSSAFLERFRDRAFGKLKWIGRFVCIRKRSGPCLYKIGPCHSHCLWRWHRFKRRTMIAFKKAPP